MLRRVQDTRQPSFFREARGPAYTSLHAQALRWHGLLNVGCSTGFGVLLAVYSPGV